MISIFYPPYSFGGDAVYIYRLANALAQRAYEVDVVHSVDAYNVLSSTPPQQQYPQHPNITVHSLRSRWGGFAPLLAQQTGRPLLDHEKLRAILCSKKFDVIHFHNISLFGPGVLTLEPDYEDYIKLYTMHEHWLVCPMHNLWKNNRRICDKPTCFTCTLSFKRPPQWWRYARLLAHSVEAVDAFISPSRHTMEMHRRRGFPRTIVQLPNFVSPPPSDVPPSGEPVHPRPFFLFVGRLEEIKGVQEVIPIFRQYPHADLLIAGRGNYEEELRRQAAGLKNVIFLGWLPQDRLRALYRNAIAVVVPSICYEVFPLIVLEALSYETPVIVNGLGSLIEVVEESGGGLIYRNQAELLDSLDRLRTDPALRAHLAKNGHRIYRERWTDEAHTRMYFELIESVATRKFGELPWRKG
jgi:glycosyltransferase involved in cell wall biosynthesis